jgi:hypothetical protein
MIGTMRSAPLFLLLFLRCAVATAQVPGSLWVPEECPEEDFGQRLFMRADAVRRATVGQPMYSLHPQPGTNREAVEIILDHLSRQVEGTGRSVNMSDSRANGKALLEFIASGRARFDFSRVAQWRPKLRCDGPGSYARWYFLVRAFDEKSGREILRAAVDEFGFPASWMIRFGTWADDWMRAVTGLDVASKRLEAIAGREVRDLQYVEAADSAGLNCSHLAPCIAARDSDEGIYVMQAGDPARDLETRLVRIPPGAPSATETDLAQQPLLANVPDDRTWISVGGTYRLGDALTQTDSSMN